MSERTSAGRGAQAWARGRAARWAGTFAMTAGLIAVLTHDLGAQGLLTTARHARLDCVAAAFAGSCACVLLGVVRWRLVLGALGFDVHFRRALQVVLATWPPAVVVPSRANELLRAVAIREAVPLTVGIGSVLAEKVVDLSVLLAFAALGAALQGLWLWSALIAAAFVAQGAGLLLLAIRRDSVLRAPLLRRGAHLLKDLLVAMDHLAREPVRLFCVGAVSLAIRVLTVGITQALLLAMGAPIRTFDTLTLWPAATLAGTLPVTLGGMGTRDAAFVYLLHARDLGSARSAVLAATLGYSAVAVWSFALIGLPFMIRELVGRRRA